MAMRSRRMRSVSGLSLHRDFHERAGIALEPCAHLVGRESAGILAVDLHDPVADLQSGAVGRRAFVGLGDDDVIALFADQGADAAVFSRGEQFEIRHLLFGHELRVGVERADHAGGCPLHQFVGVDRVDIAEREFAHHVDGDLHVAAQPEVVAYGADRQRKGRARRQDGGVS